MKNLLFFTLIIGIAFYTSCEKQTLAGLGGNSTLNTSVTHHGSVLDSISISIKFNSLEAPADDSYDLSQQVNKTTKLAVFSSLKKGKYYLFAEGWDPSINKEVKGGIPFTIDEEKSYNIEVPVTEKH